jgi:hypothetical protein
VFAAGKTLNASGAELTKLVDGTVMVKIDLRAQGGHGHG